MANKSPLISNISFIGLTILLLIIGVLLMIFDYKKEIPIIRNSIQILYSTPIKKTASWPKYLKNTIDDYFTSQKKLLEENKDLKDKIVWFKTILANQTTLEADYRRLKSLFESTATQTRPAMIAEILDSHIDSNRHQIEINRGLKNNVFLGQIAVDGNGIVGQVTDLTKSTSEISLVTDQRQSIPVFIERNRLQMISRGSGSINELNMNFVSKGSDVRIGDKIVTSGLGGRYPRGYALAIITSVNSSPIDEFMQIKAKPLALLDRLLEVLLISKKEKIEDLSYVDSK